MVNSLFIYRKQKRASNSFIGIANYILSLLVIVLAFYFTIYLIRTNQKQLINNVTYSEIEYYDNNPEMIGTCRIEKLLTNTNNNEYTA